MYLDSGMNIYSIALPIVGVLVLAGVVLARLYKRASKEIQTSPKRAIKVVKLSSNVCRNSDPRVIIHVPKSFPEPL